MYYHYTQKLHKLAKIKIIVLLKIMNLLLQHPMYAFTSIVLLTLFYLPVFYETVSAFRMMAMLDWSFYLQCLEKHLALKVVL